MDIPPIVRCVLNRIDGSNLGRFSRTIPKEAFTTKECTTTEDNTKPKGCSGNSNEAPRDLRGHKKPSLNVNTEPWTLAEAPGASTPKTENASTAFTKPNKEVRRRSLTFKPLTLSKLVEADIAEIATLIKSLVITPGASCEIHDCFNRNIETLAQTSLHRPINLSKKVLKVVIARVNSILDLFSFTDSTKLIFALAHLDTRLIPIYQPLITHYIYCLNSIVDGTPKIAPEIETGNRYVSKSVGSNNSDISHDASDVSLNSINNKCVALHCNKVVPLTQLPQEIVESIAVVITSVELLTRNILHIRPKHQDVDNRANALDLFKKGAISDMGNVSIRDSTDPTSLEGAIRKKSTDDPADETQENSIAKTDKPYKISMDHCYFGSTEDIMRQSSTNETIGSTFNSSVIEAPDILDSELSSMFKWLQACVIQLSSTLQRYLQMIGTCDNTYLLPIAQLMGSVTLQLPTMCEYVFSNVNLAVMDRTELHDFIHACALSTNIHQVDLSNVIMKCMNKLMDTNYMPESAKGVSKVFHSLYLTGKMDTELMTAVTNHMIEHNMEFRNYTEFYRIGIPIAIAGLIVDQRICQWILSHMASNAQEFAKVKSHYLFLLTAIANNIDVKYKPVEKIGLQVVSVETDIYEKAEVHLRQQDGDKECFPNTRAAVVHLIDMANGFIESSSHDELIQILLLNCVKRFKPNARIKFALLKEAKRRVNEMHCGGITHVMQTLFTLFSPNSPELIEVMTMYLDRVVAEITQYNTGEIAQIEAPGLFSITFFQDVNILANMLSIFDRCNLNRGELATQVVTLLERHKYQQLENAHCQSLIDIIHFLAFSLDQHEAIDIIAIVLHQRIGSVELTAGQLAAIAECFIAAPMALNPMKHAALITSIKLKAKTAKGEVKILEKVLKKLDNPSTSI